MKKRIIAGFCGVAAIFLIWIVAWKAIGKELVLPGPGAVFKAVGQVVGQGEFISSFLKTFGRVFSAFCLSIVLGIGAGIGNARSSFFKSFFRPFVVMVQSTPVVALIMIIVFMFSSSDIPLIAAVLMGIPVVMTSVETGVMAIPERLRHVSKVYGFSKRQNFFYIDFHYAFRNLKEVSKTCLGLIWKAITAGEVLSLPKFGLGSLMADSSMQLETAKLMALALIVVISSFASVKCLELLIWGIGKAFRELRILNLKRDFGTIHFPVEYKKDTSPAIDITDLSIVRGEKSVFEHRDFHFDGEKITVVTGKSGIGKTTLLDFMAGLLDAKEVRSGKIQYSMEKRLAYIIQENQLLEQLTVYENILLPLVNLMPKPNARYYTNYIIKSTGLSEKMFCDAKNLSGGEKQRVALARAFAFPCNVLLMDEAFTSQDPETKKDLIGLLKTLQKNHPKTVVFVTHNLEEKQELEESLVEIN